MQAPVLVNPIIIESATDIVSYFHQKKKTLNLLPIALATLQRATGPNTTQLATVATDAMYSVEAVP
jgi:hypothetical protein